MENKKGKGQGADGSKSGQVPQSSRRVIGGKKTVSTNKAGDTKFVQTVRQFGRTKIVRNKKVPDNGEKTVKTTIRRNAPRGMGRNRRPR